LKVARRVNSVYIGISPESPRHPLRITHLEWRYAIPRNRRSRGSPPRSRATSPAPIMRCSGIGKPVTGNRGLTGVTLKTLIDTRRPVSDPTSVRSTRLAGRRGSRGRVADRYERTYERARAAGARAAGPGARGPAGAPHREGPVGRRVNEFPPPRAVLVGMV
jgi:hypothetical protein